MESWPSPEQLENFLGQMMLPQTSTLSDITQFFEKYLENPAWIPDLLGRVTSSENPSIRQLANVYLRKAIQAHWASLPPETQTMVKASILQSLLSETEALVHRNTANVIVTIAQRSLQDWPEVLEMVNKLIQSTEQHGKEIGLYILSEMMESKSVCIALQPHLPNLRELYQQQLLDTSGAVQKLAIKGIGNLVMNFQSELGGFDVPGLLPQIFSILESWVSQHDEGTLTSGLNLLSQLLQFDEAIPVIIKFAGERVFSNQDLDIATRACGSDVIDDIAIERSKILAENLEMLKWVITMAMEVATESEEGYEPDSDTPTAAASRLLDTLATQIPNKIVFGLLTEKISEYRAHADGTRRKAGVIAIGAISEGCAEPMKKRLHEVVQSVIAAFHDPEDIVKQAAGMTMGNLAQYLVPQITEHHEEIMPVLVHALESCSPSVVQKVLFAIDTFSEHCESEIADYVDLAIPKLLQTAQMSQDIKTRSMAVSALTAMICSAEGKIGSHFDTLAVFLQHILLQEIDVSLRAHALQCLGQLAQASTLEIFRPFVDTGVNVSVQALQAQATGLREAAFAFFYAVADTAPDFYAPYAEIVITEAIATWQRAIAPKEDTDNYLEIRTAIVDEQTAAIHALGTTIKSLPQTLAKYGELLVSILDSSWSCHSNVKTQVLNSYSMIFTAMLNSEGDVVSLWANHVQPKIATGLVEEFHTDTVARIIETTQDIIWKISGRVPDSELGPLVESLGKILDEQAVCQQGRDVDHDERLLTNLVEFLAEFCKGYLSLWTLLAAKMLRFVVPSRAVDDRIIFLGCFGDCLKSKPQLDQDFYTTLMTNAVSMLQEDEPDGHRNAVYCIGVLCEVTGDFFANSYTSILQQVAVILQNPYTDPGTADNVVSCIGRMILANPKIVPYAEILPVWFSALPLKSDFQEEQVVLRTALALLNCGALIGSYYPHTIRLLLEGLITHNRDPSKYSLGPQMVAVVIAIWKALKQHEIFSVTVTNLPQDEQAIIRTYLEN